MLRERKLNIAPAIKKQIFPRPNNFPQSIHDAGGLLLPTTQFYYANGLPFAAAAAAASAAAVYQQNSISAAYFNSAAMQSQQQQPMTQTQSSSPATQVSQSSSSTDNSSLYQCKFFHCLPWLFLARGWLHPCFGLWGY